MSGVLPGWAIVCTYFGFQRCISPVKQANYEYATITLQQMRLFGYRFHQMSLLALVFENSVNKCNRVLLFPPTMQQMGYFVDVQYDEGNTSTWSNL